MIGVRVWGLGMMNKGLGNFDIIRVCK